MCAPKRFAIVCLLLCWVKATPSLPDNGDSNSPLDELWRWLDFTSHPSNLQPDFVAHYTKHNNTGQIQHETKNDVGLQAQQESTCQNDVCTLVMWWPRVRSVPFVGLVAELFVVYDSETLQRVVGVAAVCAMSLVILWIIVFMMLPVFCIAKMWRSIFCA